LPYTESAAITTSVTSLSDSLRGTENWITYLVVNGHPWWPVGYRISTGTAATVVTGLIAGLGLTGAVRRIPHRRFLLCVLLAGVFLIATGYIGALGNPLAAPLDHVINGPLAPLRNLRKFDPLIRLPVALGLAGLLAAVRPGVHRRVVAIAAAGAIGVLAVPLYISGLSTPGSFSSVPSYWVSAADWLNSHAGTAAVLAEPGARFGQYTWGSPLDDILEPLDNGDWASSQLSAIGSVGNTRLLETIDQQMAAGDGSAGLTALLARMGVKYVLVRNDLIRSDLRGAWPARIHQAIATSPGIVKVAQFGSPMVGSSAPVNAASSFDPPYPPVQIYQVEGAQPVAVVQPAADTLRVYGAPESLLTLADQQLLQDRPVLLNSAAPQVRAESTIVTDSLRRRVRNFGEIRDDYSPTLTASQALTTFEATADYLQNDWRPYLTVARYSGITNVTASSSDADFDAPPDQSGTGRLPFAALDGNLATMWESGSLGGPVGQWINVDLDRPVNTRTIRVAFADDSAIGPPVTKVEVSTAAGQVSDRTAITARYQTLRLPRGPTDWLQLTVTGVFRPPPHEIGRQVGIAEIDIPGVTPARIIEAPDVRLPGGGDPSAVVLAKAEPQPSGCMLTAQQWVCSPALQKSTEEEYGFDEGFTVARATTALLSGSAVLTSSALISRYAFTGGGHRTVVSASSSSTSDPQDQPWAAFDSNARTTWISGASDAHPALTISWGRSRRIDTITVQRPAGAADLLPVLLAGSGGQVRSAVLGGPGPRNTETLTLAPMKTSSLTLTFSPMQGPVQITDVEIPGVQPLTSDGTGRVTLGCGHGPAISVGGKPVPTRISGTVADLLDGRPMTFSACHQVAVAAGRTDIVEPESDGFSVQSVVVDRTPRLLAAGPSVPAQPAAVRQWTPGRRVLQVAAARQSYLIVNQNFNSGWQAELSGHVLQPVQLDGWKQGWLLPAGSSGLVTLTYPPDTAYRMALFGGLAALAVVLIIALAPVRRRAPAPVSEVPRDGQEVSARQLRARRRAVAVLVGSLIVSAVGGLWAGGYPGALLLPIAVGMFMIAAAFRRSSVLARLLWDPWLLAVLLTAAAVAGAAGEHLTGAGDSSGVAVSLSGGIPQLLCLVIVGRIIAALLLPDGAAPAERGDTTDAG
ncbi:MAG TPA: alpha-(1-_3)-arabinofuranosyltransferase family protein, partial [Streptosporangiaceae bacterium]|nr:alpha-(1->3)-arabinofuranosyltransferase family protein [Streptosporangiaceae bacterium]